MGARTKARKRAVDVLFEADQRGRAASAVLEDNSQRATARNPYTGQLVAGVAEHGAVIDNLLGETSVDWSVDRMPAVDRAILRMACYELLWSTDVPPEVVIDEAVELAKTLSTDDSPAFVNGILSRLLERKPTLDLAARAES